MTLQKTFAPLSDYMVNQLGIAPNYEQLANILIICDKIKFEARQKEYKLPISYAPKLLFNIISKHFEPIYWHYVPVKHSIEVTFEAVTSQKRYKEIVQIRDMSIALLREFYIDSLRVIGGFYSGRDHSTILNAIYRHGDRCVLEIDYLQIFEDSRNEFKKAILNKENEQS